MNGAMVDSAALGPYAAFAATLRADGVVPHALATRRVVSAAPNRFVDLSIDPGYFNALFADPVGEPDHAGVDALSPAERAARFVPRSAARASNVTSISYFEWQTGTSGVLCACDANFTSDPSTCVCCRVRVVCRWSPVLLGLLSRPRRVSLVACASGEC